MAKELPAHFSVLSLGRARTLLILSPKDSPSPVVPLNPGLHLGDLTSTSTTPLHYMVLGPPRGPLVCPLICGDRVANRYGR